MKRLDNISSHLQDNRYVRVERRGVVGLIRLLRTAPPHSQVGGCVLCAPMRAQILRAIKSLEADPSCLVIVLSSTSDRFFSSGLNIADFAEGFTSDPTQQPPVPSLFELTAAVEECPKVCIAAIQGLCSSWGLELALAADYRVCAINAKFRFPEVNFGITPCGGGARRLVCRVGIPHALGMLCYGRTVYAREAQQMGLVDSAPCNGPQQWEELVRFVTSHAAVSAKEGLRTVEDAQAAKALARQRRRLCPAYAQLPFFNRGWYAWIEHKLRDSVPRARQAPYRAIEAVRIAVAHSLLSHNASIDAAAAVKADAAVPSAARDAVYAAAERKLFELCLTSAEAKATQHVLRASQRTSMSWERSHTLLPAMPSAPASSPDASVNVMSTPSVIAPLRLSSRVDECAIETDLGVRKVAVMGADTMGTSIALMLLWLSDIEEVVLIEGNAQRLACAVRAIGEHLRSRVAAHRLSLHRCEDMLCRLRATGSPNTPFPPLLADMDLVLECAQELPALKQNIFAHLDKICKRSAIFVSVSSAQDVHELAAVTRRPGQVVGIHFFPPANHTPVVEVMRGTTTERWVVARLTHLFSRLSKFVVVSLNEHGCAGTRLLLAALYQAYAMLEDGCLPIQIDAALRKTFNFTRGLFEVEDIVGLDSTAAVRALLQQRGGITPPPAAAAAAGSPAARAGHSKGREISVRVASAEELSNRWRLPSRPVFEIPDSMIAAGALGRTTREGWYAYATPEEFTLGYALRHPIKSWLWLPPAPTTYASAELKPAAESTTPGATASTSFSSFAPSSSPGLHQCCRFPLVSLEALIPRHNYSAEYRTLNNSKRHKRTRRSFRDEEIVERIVFAMVNEAAKMMADGVIANSSDIDCISAYTLGFPLWKGGLCFYADNVIGIAKVVYKMRVYQRALGPDEFPFPCTALQEMLAKGQTFASISK
ncbi:putative enoyl-CoA hydratase/Enoyl-CoA isomerase/3- hydroxyacyl-CoA dehydrogenase [Leptomonas seymouri]|uniref:Putative enoyl-CoA hydratase/Enoyl-CoA isomerase/3-hydroxyacyl-CoA dehydrogenase n=1 Tax=Leptomonas seymouri TaxID=5684 RepID=A0A0N1HVX9_LEPSE|nr:putative enoyl-CoA hydratase/Enoyl-CoA isomerase/3- hydroxyacyl-CoA dehydrogenase [Leptomonas seymouri]|eukprot:KPI86052.1 putative enoyl-CoA hydratase/Enoyl-CoA isomerase/3- hydroxyacyl-CoA dehydrogenase [Leptomonas seymouri]